jgi:hypothetical protein
MDMLLKVEMEKGRFYVSRHDAKLSSGAVHGGGSAGMVREETGRAAALSHPENGRRPLH